MTYEFIKYNKDILLERLRKERIACGVLNSINDLENHPQLRKVKCIIGNEEVELIAPPSIEDDAVVSIVDNECPTVEGGVISVSGLNSSIQYNVSLLSLTTTLPVLGNNYTFEDLPASQ